MIGERPVLWVKIGKKIIQNAQNSHKISPQTHLTKTSKLKKKMAAQNISQIKVYL